MPTPKPPPPDPVSAPRPRLLALSCVALALAYAACRAPLEMLEMKCLDLALRARAASGWSPRLDEHLRMVEVRAEDLDRAGQIGEYAAIARAIRRLGELDAAVIVLDALFTRGSAADRTLLRDAIDAARRAGSRVVLPALLPSPDDTPGRVLRPLAGDPGENLSLGAVNMEADPDGVWRRCQHLQGDRDNPTPSLALAALLAFREEGLGLHPRDGGASADLLHYPDFKTPRLWMRLDRQPVLVHFREPYESDALDREAGGPRRIWSLDSLEKSDATAASSPFAGAVVLLGYTEGDDKTTPMGAGQPGAMIHLTALSDLLQHRVLRRASWPLDAAILLAAAGSILACMRLPRKTALAAGAVGVALLLVAAHSLTLQHAGRVLALAAPLVLTGALATAELARRHTVEYRRRIRLDTIMGYYFPPRVLAQVKANPASMEPKEADLVLLLTDVRNFSTLCERLETNAIFSLLNRVFEAQTRAVLDHDGSLEHFLGDQFLAYWGAPQPQPDGATQALAAARALIASVADLRARLTGPAAELFDCGVALHAGRGLAGNKGSARFLEYGLVGDVVNTAARVESLTKLYGVKLIATDSFLARLPSPPTHRVLDTVRVKGRDSPVTLVELPATGRDDPLGKLSPSYAAALALYREGRFPEAAARFAELAGDFSDPVSRLMQERCTRFTANPPSSWTGVFALDEK